MALRFYPDLFAGCQAHKDNNGPVSHTDEQFEWTISGLCVSRGRGTHLPVRAGHLLDTACAALHHTHLHLEKWYMALSSLHLSLINRVCF